MSGDPVREEAERLVAAAIAAVSVAARGLSGGSGGSDESASARPRFATGSEECCVCPVCRLIAAMREPDVDLAERLATGAGDLAVAVAGILRSLGRPATPAEPPSEDDPWRRATAEDEPPPQPKKTVTKKVAKKAVKKTPPPPPVEDSS